MSALPADIQAATRSGGVTLDTQQDATVLAAYPTAIDGAASPAGGYCDDMADTAALNAQRFALLKVARRRFRLEADRDLPALRTNSRTPTVTAIDEEVRANGPYLVSSVTFDRDSDRTGIEIYG